MTIIIGNIIALIASLLMIYSGILKKPKDVIYIQSVQIGLLTASNIILGGIPGAIVNSLNFIRNIICYKDKLNIKTKIIITTIMTLLCIKYNNLGIIGYLPLICSVLYTWLIDTKDEIKFKYINILTLSFWFIYDLYILSFTSAIFDFGTIITNISAISKLKKIYKK